MEDMQLHRCLDEMVKSVEDIIKENHGVQNDLENLSDFWFQSHKYWRINIIGEGFIDKVDHVCATAYVMEDGNDALSEISIDLGFFKCPWLSLYVDDVHCLECDCVYPEHQTQPISECPYCGNSDKEQTVYLQKEGN
jgi:hypothetical protein